MVEKDIELNEREITEMEEEFVNLEKLHVDDDAEGARYLSSFRPLSLSQIHTAVSVSFCASTVLWTFVLSVFRETLCHKNIHKCNKTQ